MTVIDWFLSFLRSQIYYTRHLCSIINKHNENDYVFSSHGKYFQNTRLAWQRWQYWCVLGGFLRTHGTATSGQKWRWNEQWWSNKIHPWTHVSHQTMFIVLINNEKMVRWKLIICYFILSLLVDTLGLGHWYYQMYLMMMLVNTHVVFHLHQPMIRHWQSSNDLIWPFWVSISISHTSVTFDSRSREALPIAIWWDKS